MNPSVPLPLLVALSSQNDRESILRAVELIQRDFSPHSIACEERGQGIILSGDDELHLEEFQNRLREGYEIESGPLRVRYLRTVRSAVEAQGKYLRQTGSQGNYGHCWLRIEPAERIAGNQFKSTASETDIPAKFIPSIEKGMNEACSAGVLSDIAISNVVVTLFNGSYHEEDSNELAFYLAALEAMKKACADAAFDLLEPVVHLALETPHSVASWLCDDIRARRGRLMKVEREPSLQIIEATIPIDEVLSQSPRGRPAYRFRFVGYDLVSEDEGDAEVRIVRPSHPGGSLPHKGNIRSC